MAVVFERPKSLTEVTTHYCPGCTHGIIHRLVAEVMDELDIAGTTIGIAPVGCSVFAYNYFTCDMVQAAHGRAPAIATGLKRAMPDRMIFSYQGDGDLASIGTAEIVHAAHRGENITVIFVNNAIYGMTGGQMAPTSLIGQKTTTSPFGRQEAQTGKPIRMSEMLATLDSTALISRTSVHNAANVIKTKKLIKQAFMTQQKGLGFSMVEVLSTCPTNWGLSPIEALKWLEENMIPYYPLKDFKVPEEVK
jgi:2-oxoglutarate ferredoxin oxidoreductase subunit beta